MEGVSRIGSRVHLTEDDDRKTSTNIVERDVNVTINGYDKRFAQVKEHCQDHFDVFGFASIGHAAYEGVEIAEVPALEHASTVAGGSAAGGPIGIGAVGGLWLGIHELLEAHAKGDAQNAAVRKDYAHVAVIGVLNLPAAYKAHRFESDYGHVSRDHQTETSRMTESLLKDRKGCALLQLHADRGMNACADLIASKMPVEAFLKANPKIAEQYQKDPAFKEGFDAYLYTEACGTPKERADMKRDLEARDAWNAADHVAIRV